MTHDDFVQQRMIRLRQAYPVVLNFHWKYKGLHHNLICIPDDEGVTYNETLGSAVVDTLYHFANEKEEAATAAEVEKEAEYRKRSGI